MNWNNEKREARNEKERKSCMNHGSITLDKIRLKLSEKVKKETSCPTLVGSGTSDKPARNHRTRGIFVC